MIIGDILKQSGTDLMKITSSESRSEKSENHQLPKMAVLPPRKPPLLSLRPPKKSKPSKAGKTKNPKKQPATIADVNKAKDEATEYAIIATSAIILTVLADKENFSKSDMIRIWNEVNNLSDSVSTGYVKIADLRKVLDEEYDILV